MSDYLKQSKLGGLIKASVLSSVVCASGAFAETITIGYQGMMNPWKSVIADKSFEAATGMEVDWRRFDSGAKVISAMASGDIDIATAGSSPIAAAISRGLDIELVWILENINEAEALVVRDGSGIAAPQDLVGKTIGVPFVSTTHFHMLFALEQFGLSEKEVNVLNMQPNAIAAAWARGDIDGAFIWDPALGQIKETGSVLLSSGDLGRWGKATFDGMVVSKEFGAKNPELVSTLIGLIDAVDTEYRATKTELTADSAMVKKIAQMTGGEPSSVPGVLALYDFPTLADQIGCAGLGCGADGGAAKALMFTSEFLEAQGKIPGLQEDYSAFINASYAEAAGN